MMFGEVPFPERFAAAAEAGFSAVEFLFPYDWPAADIAGWRAAAGVEIALFNLPPGDWAAGERGMAAIPEREAEFRDSLELALGYARALGVPRLHAMAGVTAGLDPAACRATYVANLRHAAVLAGNEGIEILIEPLNPRDMPGYFLSRTADALAIIAEVGAPNLKLQFDVYHRQIVEGDVIRGLEQALSVIGHVQIASVPDRHEPDEGELCYGEIFRRLDALGYRGAIGCEYRPRGDTRAGLVWRDSLWPTGR
ncbi:MAG: TIM barrel protein [Hyphomicrobiales bacterium]